MAGKQPVGKGGVRGGRERRTVAGEAATAKVTMTTVVKAAMVGATASMASVAWEVATGAVPPPPNLVPCCHVKTMKRCSLLPISVLPRSGEDDEMGAARSSKQQVGREEKDGAGEDEEDTINSKSTRQRLVAPMIPPIS
uniref:Uncharacterized protein n=1 Tax=Oryza sativa subsp. japonica TaxID=39947 RepID=Q69ST8_ORYSJ|nr:hypothetical protein [Oryza sativa Japonica Group]